jgi:hypothetical protein
MHEVAEKHWTLETLVLVELVELTSIVPVTTVLAQAGAAPACVPSRTDHPVHVNAKQSANNKVDAGRLKTVT